MTNLISCNLIIQRKDRRTGEKIKKDILDYMHKMDFLNITKNIKNSVTE